MRKEKKISRRHAIILSAFLVSVLLGIQLVAATAWTADAANEGPEIVILQMSNDPDTDWAVKDLQQRLSEFIVDDPFFVDRVRVVQTSDPFMAMELDGEIVVYASHGGPLGLVTGKRLTSWKTMADIVSNSGALMHLFLACDSKNIIRYGDEESGKKLYTVPGARPAEVTNVEIASTIMLTLGLDADFVEEYRIDGLTEAKQLVETEFSVHMMDFSQIILDEIETIDNSYTDTHRIYRFTMEQPFNGIGYFSSLPMDLQTVIMDYYSKEWLLQNGYLEPNVRQKTDLGITYTKNYYYEATWVNDDPPISGLKGANPLIAKLTSKNTLNKDLECLLAPQYSITVKEAIWSTLIAFAKLFVFISCIVLFVGLLAYGFSIGEM